MALKDTVAIIGAAGKTGAFIAKGLANGPYRLLLMDCTAERLSTLQTEISDSGKNTEVDVVLCCKDASWEADVIVIAVEEIEKTATAQKMREVATCKTVINLTNSTFENTNMQALLPHSNVVNVSTTTQNIDATSSVVLSGGDKEAMETALKMIKFIGLQYNVTE